MPRIGIDAHKRSCTVSVFESDAVLESHPNESFVFKTTKQGINEFMQKIPEGSTVVIESSTTGKTISRMLLGRYNVHMIAPPERKPSVKTDRRDSERIVREDAVGNLRRCYVPSPYVESLRFLVSQQMQLGESITRVKSRIHSLVERNMLQSEFEDLSDLFGLEGLQRLATIELPREEATALAMHLRELSLYASQHRQLDGEIAKAAEHDEDCVLLMSHPGIAPFTALAIKARIGEATRFPTKKHLCSYAGVVPKTDKTGEYERKHAPVKQGDDVLKYALTCAVRGAVRAEADTAVKRLYLKQIRRGKAPQDATVIAARKLTCIVWKMLTSRQRYVEEDESLTVRKRRQMSARARGVVPDAAEPEGIPQLVEELKLNTEVLQRYPEQGGGKRR
jgi:transposase